ncbi:MAG: M48 family metalloprotease [Silvanigrellales bacterium]|nr:M48 family metalloprotease [Silvanigrellales bacterium]
MNHLMSCFLPLLLLSCKSRLFNPSEAHHDENTPLLSVAPYYWNASSYADFRKGGLWAPFATGELIPQDHFMVKRLQVWADAIHEQVAAAFEKTNPGSTFKAPKPIIMVVQAQAADANAWVSGVASCIDAPVRVCDGKGKGRKVGRLFLDGKSFKERVAFFVGPRPECTKPAWSDDVAGFVAWFNTKSSECRLRLEGSTIVIDGQACSFGSGDEPPEADGLEFYTESPYVHFTTSMIALAPAENGLVGVIAHELGHYYRAHVIGKLLSEDYDYWYKEGIPRKPGRPQKVPEHDEIATLIRKSYPFPQPIVPDRELSFRMLKFVVESLGRSDSLEKTCGIGCPCENALAMLKEPWVERAFFFFWLLFPARTSAG